jgi:hypothetical protein
MKLIDWSKLPAGVAVYSRVFPGQCATITTADCVPCYVNSDKYGTTVIFTTGLDESETRAEAMRLATAWEQKDILYYDWTMHIPEWLDITYTGLHRELLKECTTKDMDLLMYIKSFRVVGLKAGWTDNPNEVTQ